MLALSLALAVAVAVASALHALLGRLQPDLATPWLAAPYGAETGTADFGLPARPADLMAAPTGVSDAVMVTRRWRLD